MLTRIITALVAIAIFAAVVAADPLILKCALAIVVFAMLYECNHVMTKSRLLKISSYVSAMMIMFGTILNLVDGAVCSVVLSIVIFMAAAVRLHGKVDYKEVFSIGFMSIYVSLCMSYIVVLREYFGLVFMLLVFVTAWGSDTGAYFSGSFLGKHKLIPHVSPKKTVEGAIGGMITATVCCLLLIFISGLCGEQIDAGDYIFAGVIGFFGSAISQLGDLMASAIKRDCGVKDYGKIFPGHGGFMDRFDSVIIIAPVLYYVLTLILLINT